MADNKDLGKELLKSNGMEFGKISNEERQTLQRLVATDKARVRRMKWATGIAWGLVVICCIVGGLWERANPGRPVGLWVVLLRALLVIAIVFTISLLVRSRAASNRQIQSTLMGIQEQLDRLSTGDQQQAAGKDKGNRCGDPQRPGSPPAKN